MMVLFFGDHFNVIRTLKAKFLEYFILPYFFLSFFLFRDILVENLTVFADREFFIIIQTNNYWWERFY